MAQTTISIPVSEELAEVYITASAENRLKVHIWLELLLREIRDPNPVSLEEIESRVGNQTE